MAIELRLGYIILLPLIGFAIRIITMENVQEYRAYDRAMISLRHAPYMLDQGHDGTYNRWCHEQVL